MTKEARIIYKEKKTVSSVSGVGKTGQHTWVCFLVVNSMQCKRMKLEHLLIPYTKINSKWIEDLNVTPDTIKLLKENIGRPLFYINRSNTFWISLISKENKSKNKQKDLIKLKSFCTTKETTDKMKIQPTEWDKIFANDMTNKGLISNIHKQFIQPNIKKQTTQLKNGQNRIDVFQRKCRRPTDTWKDAQHS